MWKKAGIAVGQRSLMPATFPRIKERKAPEDVVRISWGSDDASKKQRFTSELRRKQKVCLTERSPNING